MRNPDLIEKLLAQHAHPVNLYELIEAYKAMRNEVIYLRHLTLSEAERIYQQSQLLTKRAKRRKAIGS